MVLLNAPKAPGSDVIALDTRFNQFEAIGIAAKLYPKDNFTFGEHEEERAKWGDTRVLARPDWGRMPDTESGRKKRAAATFRSKLVDQFHRANGLRRPEHRRHLSVVVSDNDASGHVTDDTAVVVIRFRGSSAIGSRAPFFPLFVDVDALRP